MSAAPPQEVTAFLAETPSSGTHSKIAHKEVNWYPGVGWTDWLMLEWIKSMPNATVIAKNLIRGIQTRRLYKRVATFQREGTASSLIQELDALGWSERLDLCTKLHKAVERRLRRDWTHLSTVTPLGTKDFERLCESNLLILLDIPSPHKKVGYGRPLGVVPELKERLYHQDDRQATEDKAWREIVHG